MKQKTTAFLLASAVGAIAVFGLTLLVYATFFQDFLEGFSELSPETTALISRDNINVVAIIVANLSHGVLLATVITWSKFYTPPRCAAAAAAVAFLTEVYFLFTQYAIFKTCLPVIEKGLRVRETTGSPCVTASRRPRSHLSGRLQNPLRPSRTHDPQQPNRLDKSRD